MAEEQLASVIVAAERLKRRSNTASQLRSEI
jgi:hypothetical protein